jgi:uncharacterized membrane protein
MSAKKKRSPDDGSLQPRLLVFIRLLVAAAMAVSTYLAWVSLTGSAAVGCGADSGCDQVLKSRWAYWFGVPVSAFALMMYSLMLGASFRLTKSTPAVVQRKAWAWLVPGALAVAGAAIWFVGLQVFVVKALCPYCMVAHGSGFAAALLLLFGAPLRHPPDKPWELEKQVFVSPRAVRKAAFLAASALALLVAGQVVHQPKTFVVKSIDAATNAPTALQPASAASAAATQARVPTSSATSAPPAPISVPAPAAASMPVHGPRMFPIYNGRFQVDLHEVPIIGSPTNAQVIVSLFDYTCHHCRAMHPTLVEAQRMFSNSLAMVSLPMPLDPGCNPTMQRPNPNHTNACEYAKLGLSVWRADRARHHEFDEYLMAGEKPPPVDAARQRAVQLVGAVALDRAGRDPWVTQQLSMDVAMYELAYKAGQGSMPQLILGQNVAVGTYLKDDLIKLLVERLGLKTGP